MSSLSYSFRIDWLECFSKELSLIKPSTVAHFCNPSYSGGGDKEDQGSKPAQAYTSQDPISQKTTTKQGWWSGSSVGPEFKPQYHTQKTWHSTVVLHIRQVFPSSFLPVKSQLNQSRPSTGDHRAFSFSSSLGVPGLRCTVSEMI
jgi:hypothetical protein